MPNRWLVPLLLITGGVPVFATDYFLTIGGGYSRTGNQASLEANVVFFQQLLTDRHRGPRRHDVFFADGDDPGADLQITAEKPVHSDTPATDLLATLYRRNAVHLDYRNHRVPDLAGPLDPKLIHKSLERLAEQAQAGDRVIVYVTAHGSPGGKKEPFNTTIDCWNQRKVSAREFTGWLDKLPPEVPVVLVMAQCYCGGFGHAVFEDLDEQKPLRLRAGFFAQQHDLPAAGCRPDIEHDEEYSSYFWGAIAGKTRNGVPIVGCDLDGDGAVSFAEAHAHAVIAGETIDIPLKSSEVVLQVHSRLTDDETEGEDRPAFHKLSGRLETILDGGNPVATQTVVKLCKSLDLSLQDTVSSLTDASDAVRRESRSRGRGRQRSGRRDLLAEIGDKWPELVDERKWEESSLLKAENQQTLFAELQQLPSWKSYDERRQQSDAADKAGDQREIKLVKFRRLRQTLESIVMEKNLPRFATPQVVEQYQRLLALENTSLTSRP